MIVFIDNEHQHTYENSDYADMLLAARTRIKYRLEDITGDICLIIRYDHVTPELLRELNARAVFVSGNGADYEHYTEEGQAGLRAVFNSKEWPTFCFCGGMQVMGETYGAPLERIGKLDEGEEDILPQMAPGMKKEFGYQPIPIHKEHPVLEGLGEMPVMRQAHSYELKAVPDGFTCYASSDVTPVQLIIHDELPIVGTQFHPEYFTDDDPAGRIMIENFCRWAGLIE